LRCWCSQDFSLNFCQDRSGCPDGPRRDKTTLEDVIISLCLRAGRQSLREVTSPDSANTEREMATETFADDFDDDNRRRVDDTGADHHDDTVDRRRRRDWNSSRRDDGRGTDDR